MKVKSILVAHRAQINPQLGAVDALGIFDNMIQPMFPIPMQHMSIVITIEEILKPTLFEVRLNGPEGDLITKGEFQPMVDPFGVGKKILDLEKFLIPTRGRYTIEIFEKTPDNKYKFIAENTLFIADYPPQRPFTQEEINHILADDTVIKVIRTEFQPVGYDKKIKIQHSLDKNVPVQEGYITIPEDNKLVLDGKEFDLLGLRRHLEWMFGRPLPKPEEMKQPEDTKEPEENKIN
ncbi:MAG: hypothetical protein MR673_03080 [Fusobacterium perfoetens]|uniref:DUF6941 family protein n=1 Tax=Fusobacterium perfoetens TaxID=852 RepID=UPI0023F17BE4|nr:hypothetical protein [Fusobacterium perfoetens]MCI6152094.1 hypothetical protein [Fusobacterium perfoetens]MDY3238015.1 hypothetical protein [Fusobacterium perfoetens]